MDFSSWVIFITVAIAAVASPGPAILLAISNSIRYGIASVFLSTLGNISGLFILSTAAIFGLGAILKTSNTLFLIVKVIGAGYLIYLGIRQLRSKSSFFDAVKLNGQSSHQKSRKRYFSEGFLIAITNPKAILFFTALFPQFIDTKELLAPQFFVMTSAFMMMSFLALMSYGILANKVRSWFSQGDRTKWFNRAFGGIFIFIGLGVLQLKLER